MANAGNRCALCDSTAPHLSAARKQTKEIVRKKRHPINIKLSPEVNKVLVPLECV